MRRLAALGALALVVALVPACSRGGGDDGFRLALDGRAEIVGEEVGSGEHTVAEGDEVRMTSGTAVLELPGDRSVLLRADRDGRDPTVVTVGAVPEITEGDAVVLAGDETTFSVGDVDVVMREGSARVQRGLSVTVAIYEGIAEVRAAGRAFDGGLEAFRQLSIPATGVLPREAVPLVYDDVAPDPWDLRFIGDAIDLGDALDRQSRSYTGQLGPGARADAELLERVLPGFEPDPLIDFASKTPGESLVGAAIATEAGADVIDVFSFRDAGAKWGLVALDRQVQRAALLERISGAITRSPLLFAAAPGGGTQEVASGPTSTTAPNTTPPPSSGGDDDDGGGDGGDSGGLPSTTLPALEIPEITLPPLIPEDDPPPDADPSGATPEPPPTVTETIGEVVEDLLENLLPDTGDLL